MRYAMDAMGGGRSSAISRKMSSKELPHEAGLHERRLLADAVEKLENLSLPKIEERHDVPQNGCAVFSQSGWETRSLDRCGAR